MQHQAALTVRVALLLGVLHISSYTHTSISQLSGTKHTPKVQAPRRYVSRGLADVLHKPACPLCFKVAPTNEGMEEVSAGAEGCGEDRAGVCRRRKVALREGWR